MKSETKAHHQFTEDGQEYVKFNVRCESCGTLLFEFTHKQVYLESKERLMAIPPPSAAIGASSWYKPAVRVVCAGGRHEFVPVSEGEDRNQIVSSEPLTRIEWEEWMKV